MPVYSLGFRTAAPALNGFFFDIKAAARRVTVREIGLFSTAATVITAALFRTSAVGTRTTPVLVQAEDSADAAAVCDVATVWSVNPTLAGIPLRRVNVPAVIGSGFIWVFEPRELIIPVNLSIALQAIAAGPISDGYVKVEE